MDWKQLLADLKGAGVTQAQIAEHCGVTQASVSDLAHGRIKQPRWPFASALITLHGKKTRRKALAA